MEQNTPRVSTPQHRTLLSWQGFEHVHIHPNPRAIMIALALLILVVGYAVFSNNPMMAITFILIGFVGYLFLTKDPQSHDFTLTTRGIFIGNRFFAFEDLESYWIFDEEPLQNVLSLKGDGILNPYVHIPLTPEILSDVSQIMATYLPEVKQEPRPVDILEKMLHH